MRYLVGIDEVGRGPLAGPVTVAAVALPRNFKLRILNFKLPLRDSKKLTENQRELWYQYIRTHPQIKFAMASVYPKTIDKINITQAANRAATRAAQRLIEKGQIKKCKIILDGGLHVNPMKIDGRPLDVGARTIIRGDEKFTPIKLASIVAKVKRDRLLARYHKKFPKYRLNEHKGYGTKIHMAAIKRYGPSILHRLTFLKNFLS